MANLNIIINPEEYGDYLYLVSDDWYVEVNLTSGNTILSNCRWQYLHTDIIVPTHMSLEVLQAIWNTIGEPIWQV